MTSRHGISLTKKLVSRITQQFGGKRLTAPFNFAVQIGTPVLRTKAKELNVEEIKTKEIQDLLVLMEAVMWKNGALGLSAPQVGVPLRIFMVGMKESEIELFSKDDRKLYGIQEFPLKVFINPQMTILDKTLSKSKEGCLSLAGFSAEVNRYKKVKIDGLNRHGESYSWTASDFSARIVQHEMDHMDGVMFTDKMVSRTLENVMWERYLIK